MGIDTKRENTSMLHRPKGKKEKRESDRKRVMKERVECVSSREIVHIDPRYACSGRNEE